MTSLAPCWRRRLGLDDVHGRHFLLERKHLGELSQASPGGFCPSWTGMSFARDTI